MKQELMKKLKENRILILQSLLFGMFPLVCAAVYCLLDGKWISDVYLPASYWNDELIYYKQVEAVVTHGLPRGWFGFQENHGSVYPFAAWSPVILLPWVLWGKLFGWNLLSPIWSNIVYNMLAMAAFALLVRPKVRTAAIVLGLTALFTPYSRYLLCGMPEALFMALGILLVALTKSQIEDAKVWKVAIMFGIVIFLTLGRPYLGLFFVLPTYFAMKKSVIRGGLLSLGIAAVTMFCYATISRLCSSPYIEPIVETEWLSVFSKEGLGAGLQYIIQTLWSKTDILFQDFLKRAVKYGLIAGSLFGVVGITALMLLVYSIRKGLLWKREKKGKKEYWLVGLSQFLMTAGMILALFLFYRMGEGSKHLMIFILMSLLWIALLEEKSGLMKIAAAVLCLYFFVIKASAPYDWQVPYDDGVIRKEAEELKAQLDETMVLADSEDRYDNTVIWLASDYIGEESVTAAWGLLYMIPEGFGINFCTQVHVMEHVEELQSAYIAVLPNGMLEEKVLMRNADLIGSTKRMNVYKLR